MIVGALAVVVVVVAIVAAVCVLARPSGRWTISAEDRRRAAGAAPRRRRSVRARPCQRQAGRRRDRGQAGRGRPRSPRARICSPVGSKAPRVHAEDAGGQTVSLADCAARRCCSSSSRPGARTARPRRRTSRALAPKLPAAAVRRSSRSTADGEDAASVFAYHVYFGLPFPALLDPEPDSPGTSPTTARAGRCRRPTSVGYYPTFYVIDPHGRIAWRGDGEQPDALLRQRARARRGDSSASRPRDGRRAATLAVPLTHARAGFTPREKVERPADKAVRRANLRRIGRLFRAYWRSSRSSRS